MALNSFRMSKKGAGALSALLAALMLLASCTETNSPNPFVNHPTPSHGQDALLPPSPGIPSTEVGPVVLPPAGAPGFFDTIEVLVRTDPVDPHLERFLDDWRFQIFNIDDEGRQLSQVFYGESTITGGGLIGLPSYMFSLPLVISAFNDVYPPSFEEEEDHPECNSREIDCDEDEVCDCREEGEGLECFCRDQILECRSYEIFVPPNCWDKAVWVIGPFEDALWDYYREAAERRAEAWNPSQVDCATWITNMQLLLSTDEISDELEELSDTVDQFFDEAALIEAFQENQQTLVPTRPPICMAERRHNGGGLGRGDELFEGNPDPDVGGDFPYTLDDTDFETSDTDPVIVGGNGIIDSICGVPFNGSLTVNGALFNPDHHFLFDEDDFFGTVSEQDDIVPLMDVNVFNVRHTNGREADNEKYDDACAVTSLIEFTNKDDDEQDVFTTSGVTFVDLFHAGDDTTVYLTSDGDAVIDDNDIWAILYDDDDVPGEERVIVVELMGYRQGDFRDVLHMELGGIDDEDLFIGLRADYELNEEEVDGERAFLGYTITTWDATTAAGRHDVRINIANCYEAADVWARQFFVTDDFQHRREECCLDDECVLEDLIHPLVAAEFAVRSQCFSNSRSQQRWQSAEVGFWNMNTHHGVAANVIINPGWLAPELDFELYIQKFDEAVFKGPRLISRTDEVGQLMVAVPTLVEGDRVLIKSEDSCCDDYDLVLPCVPEFTGFAGAPLIPYVPHTVGPPPLPPAVPLVTPVGPAPIAGVAIDTAATAAPVVP